MTVTSRFQVRLNWLDAMYEVNVTLLSASGLKAADSNGKSDPYIKLKLNRREQHSRTEKKTLDPVYNEDFTWMAKKGTVLSKPLELQAVTPVTIVTPVTPCSPSRSSCRCLITTPLRLIA